SPDLNPIEFIWKSIKRELSPLLIDSLKEFQKTIQKLFNRFSKKKTFAKGWIKKFYSKITY
ncbi:MAG: IS630 family transposase, partial [Thermoplasmata archaeon]